MDIKVQIGIRIRELREAKKLSQQDFADAAELERSYITHVENGKRNITIDSLYKVINALEVTPQHFFNSKLFAE